MSVTQWLQSQAADFYDTGIQKLVPRYGKCLNSGSQYVEKTAQHLLYHQSIYVRLNIPYEHKCRATGRRKYAFRTHV